MIRQIPLDRRRMFDRACASDVNGLRHWSYTSTWQRLAFDVACFWSNYTVINWLLTIFVHNCYAQLIYYIYGSRYCEPLTDWSIPLKVRGEHPFTVFYIKPKHLELFLRRNQDNESLARCVIQIGILMHDNSYLCNTKIEVIYLFCKYNRSKCIISILS